MVLWNKSDMASQLIENKTEGLDSFIYGPFVGTSQRVIANERSSQ